MTTKRLTLCGLLIALAMIFSYLEALIPFSFGVPGVKLGLANLVVIVAVYKLKWTDVLMISVFRVVLSGILFSNLTVILYSLAGALFSIFVMLLMKRCRVFGRVGVSIGGGVAHNIGQLLAAFFVIDSRTLLYYMPVLLLSGSFFGALIGVLAGLVLQRSSDFRGSE